MKSPILDSLYKGTAEYARLVRSGESIERRQHDCMAGTQNRWNVKAVASTLDKKVLAMPLFQVLVYQCDDVKAIGMNC